MAKKKDLGKGIRALLSNIEAEPEAKQVNAPSPQKPTIPNKIPLSYIEANPYQPRRSFDESELNDLVDSIRVHGIIQPVTVKRLSADKYHIISGERRFRAAQIVGLADIPVYIRKAGDQEMLELALIENIQRADLNPIDIAISYQRLIDEFEITHESISGRVGKKRSTITNYLRLLKLSPSAQEAIKNKSISMGHAKVLTGVESSDLQLEYLRKIINDKLSVRQAEALLKGKKSSSPKENKSPQSSGHNYSAELKKIIDELSEKLGTKVRIDRNAKGQGKFEIPFTSDNHFNHILDNIIDE